MNEIQRQDRWQVRELNRTVWQHDKHLAWEASVGEGVRGARYKDMTRKHDELVALRDAFVWALIDAIEEDEMKWSVDRY